MTSLDALPQRHVLRPAPAVAGGRWSVSVTSDIDAASRAWLSLEMQGLATPYQTLGWQRAALASFHAGSTPCLITLRDQRGKMAALIPLVIMNRRGVRAAVFSGGKHANYNMGLFTEEAATALDKDQLQSVLREAAVAAAIDLFDFRNQPTIWRGAANPLVLLPHQPAASSAWRADLSGDAEAFMRSLMSSESRKKLRHKERHLGALGPVSYAEAVTPAEAEGVLRAFLEQKRLRFAAQGIANPFEDPAALTFLDQACVKPLADGPPAPISLFAMLAGERVLAVFGGVIHAGRFSGMFTSFDPDPAVMKYSPGELLLYNLIKTMCGRGLTAFDLGAGDAAYKTNYCAIAEPLFDSYLPMTLKGRLAAIALAARGRAKSALKQHKHLIQPIRRLIRR